MTTAAIFTAGIAVGVAAGIAGTFLWAIRRGSLLSSEVLKEQREQRAKRDRHGRLRVVPNCKGGKV